MAYLNNSRSSTVEVERNGNLFIKTEIIDETYEETNYSFNHLVDYRNIDPGDFVTKELKGETSLTGFISEIKTEEHNDYILEDLDSVPLKKRLNLISNPPQDLPSSPLNAENQVIDVQHDPPLVEKCTDETNKSLQSPTSQQPLQSSTASTSNKVKGSCEERKRVEALIPHSRRFPVGDYKCYCCDKKFKLLTDWEDHIVEYLRFTGCYPKKGAVKEVFYRQVKRDSDGKFTCQHCSKRMTALFAHFKRCHENLELKCAICPSVLKTHQTLKGHLDETHKHSSMSKKRRRKNTDKEFMCDECGMKSKYIASILRHVMAYHNTDKQVFSCFHCKYKSSLKSRLRTHIKNSHQFLFEYCCFYCPYRSHLKQYLKNHISQQHSSLFNGLHKKTKTYNCNRCYKALRTLSGLNRHKWTCSQNKMENYPCRLCSESFLAKYLCHIHINTTHLSRNKFRCDECSHIAKDKFSLQKHILARHMVKCYCHYCSRMFSTKYHVSVHINSCHNQSRVSFKCKMCKYKTFRKLLLKQHINVKHNPNPVIYICYHCNHQNKLKHKLSQHMQTKHKDILKPKKKKKKKE